ncbi:hypothetical protein NM208_g10078 [Fusarium decemcellulare]|uniref:Uncharacterized protein n=1 Tax=Fusarium decemcellulare TaxID=57161 RepID=A0ACC1RZB1_9HYPO|nr:hypothetical protein NM208_g10078 [Fusarium decemcellulare]
MASFDTHDVKPALQRDLCYGSTLPKPKGLPRLSHPQRLNGGPCAQGSSRIVRHVRRKSDGDGTASALWLSTHQAGIAFNLLALLFLAHFIPRAQPYTTKFLTLAYYNSTSGNYGQGIDDVYLITFLVVLFTGLRVGTMDYVLAPFAEAWGVRKPKDLIRFTEQSWLLIYYVVFWTFGMYVYGTSKYWLNMEELWTNWPEVELSGLTKVYMLAQWSFWLQQILVLKIEEPRKDYREMVTHHIVTISLIHACYVYHQTRVGNLILVIMDFVDIILPVAKCLKYMGYKTVCDVVFGVLLVSWIATRHVFYSLACWSVYADIPRVIGESCWNRSSHVPEGPLPTPDSYTYMLKPFWDSHGLVCFNDRLKWAFLFPLLILQCLNFIWLAMIIRIALRVLRREGAEDSRSDNEEDKEE